MSNTELSEEQMAWLAAVRGEGGRLNNLEKWFDTELNYSTRAAANKYKTHMNKWTKETDIEAKEDIVKAIEVLDTESKVSLKIKIDLKDGTSKTIPIPVSSLLDLKSISVITQ